MALWIFGIGYVSGIEDLWTLFKCGAREVWICGNMVYGTVELFYCEFMELWICGIDLVCRIADL